MLRNYTAYFVVECHDGENTYETAGFHPAATFGEAMDYIEEFFGKELCIVKHLELLDTSLIYMSPELAKQVLTEIYC